MAGKRPARADFAAFVDETDLLYPRPRSSRSQLLIPAVSITLLTSAPMFAKRIRPTQLLLAGALLVTLLVACGEKPVPPPAPVKAISTETLVKSGFYVREVQSGTWDGEPALEVSFSESLASEQDFGKLLTLRDKDGKTLDGGWSLDYDDARILRFNPIAAGADYTLDVSKEVLSSTGAQFSADYSQKIATVEQTPVFGFSGQGSLLPARASEGLPIRTVNVGAVDVEFLRVKDTALSDVLRNRAYRGRKGGWELSSLKRYSESVYSNRFEITDNRRNEQVVSLLPIQSVPELQRSGLYFAVMRMPGEFDSYFEVTHYVVSDIGVHVRKYQNNTLLLAHSLATGKPLSGVAFSVINPFGQEVIRGESNEAGQLLVEHAPKSDELLLARSGEELTVLPFNQPALDLSEFDVEGTTADAISLHIWSGRDLYRPGENVRFFALLRDFDGKPLNNQGEQPVYANLRQPDGKLYASELLKADTLGLLQWQRAMPADVPVGKWTLELGSDPEGKGRVHRFPFRIEEFLPERLKLELTTAKPVFAKGELINLDVLGSFLYGAPASGNRFSGKYVLLPDTEAVANLKGYRFGDQVNVPKAEQIDIVDQALDEQGKLAATVEVSPDVINGPITVAVIGQLFESGGRAVTRVLKRSIWPADKLVGVRPLFDDNDSGGNGKARFEVALSDQAGKMHSGSVQAKLIRVRRDYRWSYKSGLGWVSDYVESETPAGETTLALSGKAQALEFPVEWGNYRLEITDPATQLVNRYAFYAGWSWGDDNTGPDARPDKVKLALDKSSYRVGDEVSVTVTAPDAGEGLLLVESNQLLQSIPFSAAQGSVVKLRIDPSWDRHDVYLSTLVFKPGDNSNHITPKRAVGMIHLPMDRSARKLQVSLKAAQKIEPGKTLTAEIQVANLAGKKANLTLHAVDQGITNITNFSVPDPFKNFFAKRAFALDLYDVYGRIIESLAGSAAKLRYGGDAMLGALPQAKRDTAKVETVDLYSGVVELDASGKAQIPLKMPDFNGSLMLSAVVFSADSYGLAQQESIVRAPVVAEVSMPRVMAPDDRGQLNLEVTNFTESAGEFDIKLVSSKGLRFESPARSVTLDKDGKANLQFDVAATDALGVAKYAVQINGNGVKFERKYETVVRPAWSQTRTTRFEQIGAGQNINLSVDASRFYSGSVQTRVALSSRAPIPVSDAANSLFDYPYGCIEQTTSKLMPFVTLDEVAFDRLGLNKKLLAKRKENVEFGLGRIASMQAESGHFNYWPGSNSPEPTLTPFVTEVLQDAQTQGFTMPPGVLQKAQERLKESLLSGGEVNYVRVFGDNSDHLRLSYNAHAGFVLARVKQAPLGSLRSIYDTQAAKSLSPLPLVRLGLALKAAGDKKRGDEAIALALGDKWQMTDRWLGDYSSTMRDHALSLALLAEAKALPQDADRRLLEVVYQARDARYLNTQENMALVRLAKALSGKDQIFAGALIVGQERREFTSNNLFSTDLNFDQLSQNPSVESNVRPLYLLQQTVGISKQAPQPSSDSFFIRRRYYMLDGKPLEGAQIREGERMIVELTLESKLWGPDFMVVDLLPGGLEAENLNLLPAEQLSGIKFNGSTIADLRSASSRSNEEFRDDRYVLATALNQGVSTYYYLVRAVSPGTYIVPPPALEDMYRADYSTVGVSIPERITVLPGN